MSTKGSKQQPARGSARMAYTGFETADFAKRRDKRRRLRDLAKASKRKNRTK